MKTLLTPNNVLSEQAAAFLDGFSEMQASMSHLSIPEKRRKIKEMFKIPENLLEPVASVADRKIPGRNGDIPLRIITPKKSANNATLVFFHRGGWVYGSNDESESLCRKIANHCLCQVVQVEYRLSPESKFPKPLEDCFDAVCWVSKNIKQPDGGGTKVIVCGESAGGNLAAATALMAQKEKGAKISGQVLIYPILTSDLILESYEKSPDKKLLSYENMQWFWQQYLPNEKDGQSELASPLKAKSLASLPRALIMTAEFDALCPEGEEYAKKLQKSGVDVVYKRYPKVIHGFLDIPVPSPEIQNALNDLKAFVDTL